MPLRRTRAGSRRARGAHLFGLGASSDALRATGRGPRGRGEISCDRCRRLTRMAFGRIRRTMSRGQDCRIAQVDTSPRAVTLRSANIASAVRPLADLDDGTGDLLARLGEVGPVFSGLSYGRPSLDLLANRPTASGASCSS
jgi:hypothetical protein